VRKALLILALAAGFSAAASTRLDAAAAGEVFNRAAPGVVTIVAAVDEAEQHAPRPFVESPPGGVRILGSGVVLSPDGYILTAHHVVSGSGPFCVVLSDLTEQPGRLVASEPVLDIALVKIEASDLDPLEWRTGKPAAVGEEVFALGTPSVFVGDPTPSLSAGIVSALHRTVGTTAEDGRPVHLPDLIETDARVSPGQSGGALLDDEGRLLGMCVAVYSPLGAERGRAYAVPADSWLRSALDSLRGGEPVRIGRLGALVGPVPSGRARRFGVAPRSGVHVLSLESGGPLEEAGVRQGDIIMRVAGAPVRRTTRFRQVEMRLEPGSKVKVFVARSGEEGPLEFEVEVGSDGSVNGEHEASVSWRGMRVSDLTPRVRERFGTRLHDGVIVVSLESHGPAHRAGLREGDIIREVNDDPVKNLADFRSSIEKIGPASVVRVRTSAGIGHIEGASFTE